jgi:hypothetical protein
MERIAEHALDCVLAQHSEEGGGLDGAQASILLRGPKVSETC